MTDEFLIDTWSAVSHKLPVKTPGGAGYQPPQWTGIHAWRLAVYKVLASYLGNCARMFLDVDQAARDKRREYGDPSTLRDALLGALVGDEQQVQVDGASDDIPLDDETGEEVGEERTRIEQAQDREEWLTEWGEAEHVIRKINETEGKAIGLGDGVYVLQWSSRKRRPLLRIYDPGFYFPVMSDSIEDEFPTTVHLAWQYDETNTIGEKVAWVRRITWRLAAINASAVTHPDSTPVSESDKIRTWIEPSPEGSVNATGTVTRALPYQDEPTDITCYLSDGRWRLDKTSGAVLPDLSDDAAEWFLNDEGIPIRDLDLLIDFLPVVHLPNTSAEEEHYGRSALLNVAQIFDDLAAVDTDLSAAASTTGAPPIVVHGSTAADMEYRPGKIFNVAVGGGLDVVDTSRSLDALLKYKDALLDRLQTNARVPGAVLGRVDPSKIASGVLLALSFGPLQQVVKEMRLVRKEKNPLIPKFAQRLAIVGGELDGPVLDATIQYGSFLPSDKAAMVEMVRTLIGNGVEPALISRQTGIAMLIEVGFDIEEAAEELDRIQSEDFAGAVRLLDATGDDDAVFEYLQREKPAPKETPGLVDAQGNPIPPSPVPPAADLNAPPTNTPPGAPPPQEQ